MRKVRLFCDWQEDSLQLVQRLQQQTDGLTASHNENQYRYRDIRFVWDNSYDYAVVFNLPIQDYLVPPARTIGLSLEPPEIMDYFPQHRDWRVREINHRIGHMYSFCSGTQWKEALGIGFATVPGVASVKRSQKQHNVCMIVSDKRMTAWHNKRHEIKDALLNTDLDIHFYGRHLTGEDSRIRGQIRPMGKFEVLDNYKYCIDFENSPHKAITDKFFDPILRNTVPITNADILFDLVPYHSFEFVDFQAPVEDIVDSISNIIRNDQSFYEEEINETQKLITTGDLCLVEWIYQRIMELN